MADIIQKSEGNIIRATKSVNKHFKMKNDFPIFMAITDIAWFRPDIINPASPVPTGIGAVAYLDRLQEYLGLDNHELTCQKMIELQKEYWPDAKRNFILLILNIYPANAENIIVISTKRNYLKAKIFLSQNFNYFSNYLLRF